MITANTIQRWLTLCQLRQKDCPDEQYTLINECWDHEIDKIVPGQFNYGYWGQKN